MKLLQLPKWAAFLLSALLTCAEAIQLQVSLGKQAHAVLTMAIVIVAAVAPAITPQQFRAELPAQVVHLLSGLVGALLVLEQSAQIGPAVQTVIAAVVVAAVALGVGAAQAPLMVAARRL